MEKLRVVAGVKGGVYSLSEHGARSGAFSTIYPAKLLVDTPFLPSGSPVAVKVQKDDETLARERRTSFRGPCVSNGRRIFSEIGGALTRGSSGPRLTDITPSSLFENELAILTSLSHPGVVTLYDSGNVSGLAFLVEEILPSSLDDFTHIREGMGRSMKPMGAETWRILAGGLLETLSAVHDSGIIHNDINDKNVMFDGRQVKLVDFGISVTACEAGRGYCRGYNPEHIAPEVSFGAPYGTRADIFSAASLLYYKLYYRMGEFQRSCEKILKRSMDGENPASRHPSAMSLKEELLAVPVSRELDG